MSDDWDERVRRLWSTAGNTIPDELLAGMRVLAAERPPGDAAAAYELASAYDFLGREADAIPLYRQAIEAGLDAERLPQARIQLASSLRNVGQPEAAVDILSTTETTDVTGDAHRAFLALSLFDAGRPDAALAVALDALAKTLPLYGRAITGYAAGLSSRDMKTL
jgi:tetratricopeptide (TPR) repeat protein